MKRRSDSFHDTGEGEINDNSVEVKRKLIFEQSLLSEGCDVSKIQDQAHSDASFVEVSSILKENAPHSEPGIAMSIKRKVSSSQRIHFIVTVGEDVHFLRSRADVVRFLAKVKWSGLTVDDFSFKSKNLGSMKFNEENYITLDSCFDSGNILEDNLLQGNDDAFDVDLFESCDTENDTNLNHSNTNCDNGLMLQFERKLQSITHISGNVCDNVDRFDQALACIYEVRRQSLCTDTSAVSTASELKTLLAELTDNSEPIQISKTILQQKEICKAIRSILQSQVETEIELMSIKDERSSSMSFPPDINSNIYCDIIEEAFLKTPNLLEFIVNITDSGQELLTPSFVIRVANILTDILSCKDKRHSVLQKINSLHLVYQKSSVNSLKIFGQKGFSSGYTEATRLIDDMSELAEFFKSSKYCFDLGMQLTADNVDTVMKETLEHWILAYSRMDPIRFNSLSKVDPVFDLTSASHEIVFLEDKEVEYLKKCCIVVLARKLRDPNIGCSRILKHISYVPVHNYTEMLEQQDIFFESLEPLHEMDHQGNACGQ